MKKYLHDVENNLERVLNDRRLATTGGQQPLRKHLQSIDVVEKTSIYGYHHVVPFIRISLYNPLDVSKVADILEKGAATGGLSMQPYESSIPYLLQFTLSWNITPMGFLYIHEEKSRWRAGIPPSSSSSTSSAHEEARKVVESLSTSQLVTFGNRIANHDDQAQQYQDPLCPPPRVSTCELGATKPNPD